MSNQKIDSSLESLLGSIQDVFRDCSEQKKRAVSELKERKRRFENDVEDFEQMKIFADANNGTMKVINDLIAKKIELVKIHARLINTHGVSTEVVDSTKNTSMEDIIENSQLMLKDGFSSEELVKLRELAEDSDYTPV